MSKLYIMIPVDRWLDGSTRDELGSKRAIWVDFIALARRHFKPGECEGVIPLPRQSIARICKVSLRELNQVIEKCIEYGKIEINDDGFIQLINWDYYNPSRQQVWDEKHPEETYKRKSRYESDKRLLPTTNDDKRRLEEEVINNNKEIRKRSSKKKKTSTTTTFSEYVEELMGEYPDIDFDEELKKFWLYQEKRPAKNLKLALRKWMNQARRFKAEQTSKNDRQNDRDKFVKGRYGHVVRRHEADFGEIDAEKPEPSMSTCSVCGLPPSLCDCGELGKGGD